MDVTGQVSGSGSVTAPGQRTVQRPSLRVRLRALVLRPSLDRRLAQGGDPTSAPLRLRARQLTSARTRRRLAGLLERAVEEAEGPQNFRGSAVPLNRIEIRRCSGLLYNLAAELSEDQPLTPRGVLLVRGLLRDGGSPLYAPSVDGALEFELRRARAALLLR
jgi:hypothetical protein